MQEIFIVGEMKVAPEKVAEVEAVLITLREQTRKEAGCIFYQFFEGEGQPGVFATIEHWQSIDAEAAHWQKPHLKEAVAKLGPLLIGEMRVSRYNRMPNESGCA